MQYLTSIDLSKNQLKNAVIHNVLSTDEIIAPFLGQICFQTVDKKLFMCTQENPIVWTAVAENAFSNVAVNGQPTISADGVHDTLNIEAGNNITLTTNNSTDTLTIGSTDTLYTISTLDGDTNYSKKIRLTDSNSITDDVTIAVAAVDTNYGLTISQTNDVITLAHSDTSSVPNLSSDNTGNTVIQDINFTFDTYGHVTGATVGTTTLHSQNTDTGTTSSIFTLDMDNTGSGVNTYLAFNRGTDSDGDASLKWNEVNDRFELLADGVNLADLKINNLTVDGTLTAINSNEVNIGDSRILLNAEITESEQNESGGIDVKRLAIDDVTRKDASLIFNNVTNRWETTFGSVTGALVTALIANKFTAQIGDNTNRNFVVQHNFNTRDLSVTVRETNSPYSMVMTDIEYTTEDTITVKFALAPALNAYTITIIG